MSIQNNFISFVPSAAVPSASLTVTPPNGPSATTFALPAVDAGNVAMTVQNLSADTAWFALGTAANGLNPGPAQRGSMVLNPGQTVLLLTSGGAATYCAVLLKIASGSVTLTRGTATTVAAFTTHDDAPTI